MACKSCHLLFFSKVTFAYTEWTKQNVHFNVIALTVRPEQIKHELYG